MVFFVVHLSTCHTLTCYSYRLQYVPSLSASGKFRSNPIWSQKGGLEKVPDGLDLLRTATDWKGKHLMFLYYFFGVNIIIVNNNVSANRFLVEKLHFCYDNVVHLISCAFSFRYASTSDVFSLDLSGRKLNNIPSQNRMLCQFFRPSAPGKFHVALLIDYDGQMVEHPRDEFQSVLLLSHQLTM